MTKSIHEYVSHHLQERAESQEESRRDPFTIRPTREERARIKFLAEELGRPRSALAMELLSEAIEDAFAAYLDHFDPDDRGSLIKQWYGLGGDADGHSVGDDQEGEA